jgi:hypothetical protein
MPVCVWVQVLYNGDGAVMGVATGDVGIGKDGKRKVRSARAGGCGVMCTRKAVGGGRWYMRTADMSDVV